MTPSKVLSCTLITLFYIRSSLCWISQPLPSSFHVQRSTDTGTGTGTGTGVLTSSLSIKAVTFDEEETTSSSRDGGSDNENKNSNNGSFVGDKLILWRGEKSHGSSLNFRHAEFKSALCTILKKEDLNIIYSNALSTSFDFSEEMSDYQIEVYQNAMQYAKIYESNGNSNDDDDDDDDGGVDRVDRDDKDEIILSNTSWIKTAERCSLIRGLYEIVAEGETYEDLAEYALTHNTLHDLMIGNQNENHTWRIRLRQYGSTASETNKAKQYGKKMRSPLKQERKAVFGLKELLLKLGGEVDLKNADVSLYVLEGLKDCHGKSDKKFLGRLLTNGGGGDGGKATSTIAPKTRVCVTNTPLAPIEAFTLCNAARIKNGDRVLDPFAGSCTTLLAASMLAPSSIQTVGIEIAHNGQVNRTDILEDFKVRDLIIPACIIHGDAMDEQIREDARVAVGNEPFDCIVTDPPYGIREKTGYCEDPPLVQLVKCIAVDRDNNKRLLKKFGRLVAFVPNPKGEDVTLGMPSREELDEAGLEFCQMLEQPLNDSLSRWLVEYKCIR